MRHRFDALSLTFGLFFLIVAVAFLAGAEGRSGVGWLFPVGVIALGTGIVGSILRRREPDEPAERTGQAREDLGTIPADTDS